MSLEKSTQVILKIAGDMNADLGTLSDSPIASDAARFRVRRDSGPTGNPTCKLCNSGEEDTVHFLAACKTLQAERQSLLSHALLNLPDPAHDPIAFTKIMLVVDWIDDLEAQVFLLQFTHLKQKRFYQPTVNTPPFRCTLLSRRQQRDKKRCVLINMAAKSHEHDEVWDALHEHW